jgi:hypothetical protein
MSKREKTDVNSPKTNYIYSFIIYIKFGSMTLYSKIYRSEDPRFFYITFAEVRVRI